MDKKTADYMNELVEFTTKLSTETLKDSFSEKRGLPELLDAFKKIAYHADDYIESRYEVAKIECKSGCNFCCHMRVGASPIELFCIALSVSLTLSKEELNKLTQTLLENLNRTFRLSTLDHYKAKIPCPMLAADGRCSVYEYRPLACRQWISGDRSKCENGFNSPEAEPHNLYEGTAMAWGAGLSQGMKQYLDSQKLDGKSYELNFGLLRVLTTPKLLSRWLVGEKVFVPFEIES
jgi:Fe-S-cluster containining protein